VDGRPTGGAAKIGALTVVVVCGAAVDCGSRRLSAASTNFDCNALAAPESIRRPCAASREPKLPQPWLRALGESRNSRHSRRSEGCWSRRGSAGLGASACEASAQHANKVQQPLTGVLRRGDQSAQRAPGRFAPRDLVREGAGRT
jgi:hypothetical protein